MNKKKITICQGKSCRVFGGKRLDEELREKLGDRDDIKIRTSGCMGYCATSLNAKIDDELLKDTTADEIIKKSASNAET